MAATTGFKNEDWVVSEFNNWQASRWARGWLNTMGYKKPEKIGRLCAQTTRKMGYMNKADVLVLIDGKVEWLSVKKYNADYNQLDKRRVARYAEMWDLPEVIKKALSKYCGERGFRPLDMKAECKRNTKSRERFTMNELEDAERHAVLDFFNKKKNMEKVVRDVVSGTGRAAAKWMLVVEEDGRQANRSALAPVRLVVRHYGGPACITKNGNLKIGKLTAQRKGGDSGRTTAQMLQFKFSPSKIFEIDGAGVTKKE